MPVLEEAGLRHFKSVLFDVVKKDVSSALITLINGERDGEQLDHILAKRVVEIFETMGLGGIEVYNKDFEEQLIASSR